MNIDIATLFTLVVMLCLVVGSIFAWGGTRGENGGLGLRAAIALFAIAVGVSLVLARGLIPGWLSIVFANTLVTASFGVLWSVARLFERRSAPVLAVFAGSALWLFLCCLPPFYTSLSLRIAFVSSVAGIYAAAAAYEFWRGRGEKLQARLPLAALCLFHAACVTARAIIVLIFPPVAPLEGGWLQNLLMLEAPLSLIAGSFLAVSLVRERAENELRHTAEVDELTGIRNRRAFFAQAESLVREANARAQPVVLLLFDLDHFKAINDRFGHATGDRTLCAFAEVASRAIRTTDLFGRIGGEEFAALLPACDAVTAHRIAERVRSDFTERALIDLGQQMPATVSAGIASQGGGLAILRTLMSEADEALYRSKRDGRNRVTGSLAAVG